MILNIPPTLSQIRAGNLRVPLQFNADLTSQYDSAKTQILSNGTSGVNLLLGVSTSGFILLKSGITNLFAAGSAQGVQNQNSWGVGVYGCNVGGSSYSGFSSTGLSDILGNVPTGFSYKLFVQGVEKYRLGAALCELDRISLGGVIGSSVDPGAGSLGLGNIQFTQDSSAFASSSKTQVYSDGNAGSLFVRVPTAKMVQGLVNSNILLNLGRGYNVVGDTNWAIGKYGAGSSGDNTATGINGSGTIMGYNVPSGGSHSFSTAGFTCVSFTDLAQRFYTAGTESAHFDSSGLTLVKNLYFNGVGSASSTLTTQWADAANGNLLSNVPSLKYEQHRVGGYGSLSLGRVGVTTGDSYWAIGLYNANGVAESSVYGGISNELTTMILNVPTGNTIKFKYNAVEKYRFAAALAEFDRLSLGGTIGSSTDPGGGSIGLTGQLLFTGAGTSGAATSQIYCDASAGNMYVNVPTAKTITLRVNGSNLYTFSTGLVLADAVNVVPGSTTGTKFGTATTNKMGFWNATPVVQPALTGTSTTLTTAGSTNALYADSTSTGGIGSTAYSLPDVVRNLKTAGLLAP